MTHKISKGLIAITDLQNVEAPPDDVRAFMSESLINRDKHRIYLESVDRGRQEISQTVDKYKEDLRRDESELKRARDFSMDLDLPGTFATVSKDYTTTLKFVEKHDKIK